MDLLGIGLPCDKSAERSVLGAMLLYPDLIDDVLSVLKEEDFCDETHRLLFRVISDLYREYGADWDHVIFKDYLSKRKLEDKLSWDFITHVIEEASPRSTLDVACQIVKEKAGLRSLLDLAKDIVASIKEKKDFKELLDGTQQKLLEISEKTTLTDFVDIGKVVDKVMHMIQTFKESERVVTGIPSGFSELDMMTTGFHPSDLIILAARPAMGKTSFMLAVAHHIASVEGKPVAIFSLEMSKEQLVMRLLSSLAEVPLHHIRSGFLTDDQMEALRRASEEIRYLPIYIDDSPGLTTVDLRIKARKALTEKKVEFIAIDYLQMLRSPLKHGSRQEEVAEISRSLKSLAKELNIPIMALAQLSRQVEQRSDKRPQLADLRESGQIEQDADLILFLHRPEYYKKNPDPSEKGIAEIIVAKQRQGPTGTVKVAFIKDYAKFESLVQTHETQREEEDLIFEEESEEDLEDLDLDF